VVVCVSREAGGLVGRVLLVLLSSRGLELSPLAFWPVVLLSFALVFGWLLLVSSWWCLTALGVILRLSC